MNESKRYTNDIKRMGKILAKRPVEMFKKGYSDKTSLILRSNEIEYSELRVSTRGLELEKPLVNNVHKIEFNTPLTIDLSKSIIQSLTLTDDVYITDIINYENNIDYYIIIKQDSFGGHKIAWDENINILFKESQPYEYPYSKSVLKITPINGVLYADFEYNEFSDADAFKFTIDTTLGSNAGPTFQLPLREKDENDYKFTYYFNVDWGDGTSSDIRSWDDPNKKHTYSTDGTYQISVKGVCEAWGNYIDNVYPYSYTNSDYEKITSVDQWGYLYIINAFGMFGECSNLTNINDLSGQWCRNVTDIGEMFGLCTSLTELDLSNWNVSNVTDMNYTFWRTNRLKTLDLSNWDVSNVTNISQLEFIYNTNLTNLYINNFKLTDKTIQIFSEIPTLVNIYANNLDLENVTTTNYTNNRFSGMFSNCTSLINIYGINEWDVSNLSITENMFYNCSSLTELNLSNWNVSNVTNMGGMFGRCSSLTTIKGIGNWNISNVLVFNKLNSAKFLQDTPLDTPSYDELLIGWSSLSPNLNNNLELGANLAQYTPGGDAEAGRDILINTHNWTINDAGSTA